MERLIEFDTTLFRWVNGHHSGMFDWVMWVFSQHWSIALIILAIFLIITLRHDRGNWLWVLLGIALCFLLADQISSNAIKDGVQRLRPCWALDNVRMFHTSQGGLYGFVSSHAANAFSIVMFFSLLYGGKRQRPADGNGKQFRSPLLPYLLVVWAIIVCYSRVYLGKHYPGDVLCGALLGLGVGAVVYFAISRIRLLIKSKSSA